MIPYPPGAGGSGTAGPTGPAGPQGPQGTQGPAGAISTVAGPAGPAGPTGPVSATAGPQGPQGIQGPAGAASTVAGPQGPTGQTGAASTVAGPAGPAGPAGAASTVAGPQGAQGIQGPSGPTGPAGAASIIPGPQGPQGVQGIQGATGTQGPAGSDASVTNANVNTAIGANPGATRTSLVLGTAALAASADFAVAAHTHAAVVAGGASGFMTGADKTKLDSGLTPVHMAVDAAAQGPAIVDYFAATLSLAAASTYEIECNAAFLKSTAGTVIWTWACSSAPVSLTSRSEATPLTGYTGAVVTGAPVVAQATSKAVAATAHAVSGSLLTAVDHNFIFWVRIRTNAATTIQLRSTQSAGTLSPRAGSYMRAFKVG